MVPSNSAGGSGAENKLVRFSGSGLLAAAMLGVSSILGKLFGRSVVPDSIPGFNGDGDPTDHATGVTGLTLLGVATPADGADALDLGTADSVQFAGLHITGDTQLDGNLIVLGTKTVVNSEIIDAAANYVALNAGYQTVSGQSSGWVANYLPTTTHTIVDGNYTAGVDATSNPTVITDDANVFSAGDIIQFASGANAGFYEVLSHVGTTLTIKGVGLTATTEPWTQNQFTSMSGDNAPIRKVNVAVSRVSDGGSFQVAIGSTAPLSYVDLFLADGSKLMQGDFDADNDYTIKNLVDPTNAQDAATKAYVDANAISPDTDVTGVKTANYTAVPRETVRCDASGGTFNVTLPAASGWIGAIIEVVNEGASGTVGVARSGSDTISGATSDSLAVSQEVAGYRSLASGKIVRIY